MAKSVKNKKKESSIFQRVFWRLFGVALLSFVVLSLLSVCFYHASDPTLNYASSAEIKNYLGLFGSSTADILLRGFGFAFLTFFPALFIWGYEFALARPRINYPTRFFAFLLGVLSFATFLALLPQKIEAFELGGIVGKELLRHLLKFANLFFANDYTNLAVGSFLFVFSVLAFNYAVGITYKNWYAFFCFIGRCFVLFGKLVSYPFRKKDDDIIKVKKAKISRSKIKEMEEYRQRIEPKMVDNEVRKKPNVVAKIAKKKVSDDGYVVPSVNLLSKPEKSKSAHEVSEKELEKISLELESVLQEFGINGKIVKVRPGPVVTLYELEPAPGTKTARVIGLSDDIARSMSVSSVRIAVVSGSNTIGIEMPNPKRETVWLRELFEDPEFSSSKNTLNVVLGKDIAGKNIYADLAKMPHLLVAGTTGSGKSVGVNQMILSLLYHMSPEECKLIMIDPKMLEFSMYNGIPHLLTPVITDPSKAVLGLKWAVREMEDRYRAMAKLNVRNIEGYNIKLAELRASGEKVTRTVQTGFDPDTGAPIMEEQELDLTALPYIVVVVDEMADLMLVAGKEVEAAIQRLAQMARAAGIHLIMSTQRPSVDVITGTIKANFPTRISFQVTSKIDSRTILGEQGAEQLLGKGDMLYMPAGRRPVRIHGSFVKDAEIEKVVEFIRSQKVAEYIEGITDGELSDKGSAVFDSSAFGSGGSDDDLYAQALAVVQQDKKASTSYIQRKLRIGYNRAASIIDRMEAEGVVSAADHVGRREVI
ncbi:MAG: DNA translocase FtsK 4TM domain-containing protein [Alphaproteobacteria bacterium]|nr:DNA translocase FtsK 4TM domain-containing protein [Alphaproteobacteria bacterium]